MRLAAKIDGVGETVAACREPPVASLDAAPEHVRGDMPVSAVMAVPATELGTARGDALRIDARGGAERGGGQVGHG